MSGYLPNVRPLSQTYGPDPVDERPVENADLETGADTFVAMKADLAFVARLSPILCVRVSNAVGTVSVAGVIGAENVDPTKVVVTRSATGRLTVDWTNLGLVATFAQAFTQGTTAGIAGVFSVTSTGCSVRTNSVPAAGGVDIDVDFVLFVY